MSTTPQVPATPVATPVAEALPAVDAYAAAWDEDDVSAAKAPAKPAEAVAAEGAAAEGVDPTLTGTAEGATPTTAVAGEADTATATGAVDAAEESLEAKVARLEAENVGLRTPKSAATPAAPEPKATETPAAPEPKAAETPAQPEWYKPTDAEAAILNEYATNWPDHEAANAVRTKQAVYNAVQYVFSKMHETYAPVLQRFQSMSDAISEQLTLGALRSEHEDYDEIYNEVVAWVPTLPAAFRQGAERVMKEGTAEEVAELISAYKQQKPATAAVPAVAGTPPALAVVPRKTELSAPAKKAAQALTAVSSKRTTPVAQADANDYDGAWAEAIVTK